jgi:hypothetical protein
MIISSAAPLPPIPFKPKEDPFDFPFEETLQKVLSALERGLRDLGIAHTLAKLKIKKEFLPERPQKQQISRICALLVNRKLPIEIQFSLKQLIDWQTVSRETPMTQKNDITPEIQASFIRARRELEGHRIINEQLSSFSLDAMRTFAASHMMEFRTGRRQFIFGSVFEVEPRIRQAQRKKAMIYFTEAGGKEVPDYIRDPARAPKDWVDRWITENCHGPLDPTVFRENSGLQVVDCTMPESLRRLWEHFGPETFIQELFEPLAQAIEQLEKPLFAREFFTRLDLFVKGSICIDRMIQFLKGLPEELQSYVPRPLFFLEQMGEDKSPIPDRVSLVYRRVWIDFINSPYAIKWKLDQKLSSPATARSFLIPDEAPLGWPKILGRTNQTCTLIGRIRVISNPDGEWTANPGDILVLPDIPHRYFCYINARAAISEAKGSLEHGQAILEQLGIPCISSVKRAVDELSKYHGLVVQLHLGATSWFGRVNHFEPPPPREIQWPVAATTPRAKEGGKGAFHLLMQNYLANLPDSPGITVRLAPFTIIPTNQVLTFYDTPDPTGLTLRAKIEKSIETTPDQEKIFQLIVEHAKVVPIPVPNRRITGHVALRSSGAFQSHPTLSYPGMFASAAYDTDSGRIPAEAWAKVLSFSFREDAYSFQKKCGIDPCDMALIVEDHIGSTHFGKVRSTESGDLRFQITQREPSFTDEYLIDGETQAILEAYPEDSVAIFNPHWIRKIAVLMKALERLTAKPVEIEFHLQVSDRVIIYFTQLKTIQI